MEGLQEYLNWKTGCTVAAILIVGIWLGVMFTKLVSFLASLIFTASILITTVVLTWIPSFGKHYMIAINAITFVMYGVDKWYSEAEPAAAAVKDQSAKQPKSRIPEIYLHIVCFCGGSVGAYLGQKVFNHKTSKWSFRIPFYLSVIVSNWLVLMHYSEHDLMTELWIKWEQAKKMYSGLLAALQLVGIINDVKV
jgi:uncharacterized membrane protein YsdA (DUF1294 family)